MYEIDKQISTAGHHATKMAAYYGKSHVFDPRFLARKAKLDSINSISQNPHVWTSILGKLSVDPCFPLKYSVV